MFYLHRHRKQSLQLPKPLSTLAKHQNLLQLTQIDVFHVTLSGSRGFDGHISLSKEKCPCKTSKEICDSGDQYWKPKAVKHGELLNEMFTRHQESAKHIAANKTKHTVLKIIHGMGNIRDRLKRRLMNKNAKEEEENYSVITKISKFSK